MVRVLLLFIVLTFLVASLSGNFWSTLGVFSAAFALSFLFTLALR